MLRLKVGLFCILATGTFGCRSTESSQTREVEDIANVTHAAGSNEYVVTCRRPDGSNDLYEQRLTMAEFQQKVADNSICEEGGGSAELFCEPYSSSSHYVARVADGERLGSSTVSPARCREIISNASQGWVCAPYSSSSTYVAQIENGETLGSTTSYDKCFQITAAASREMVCNPYSSSSFYVTLKVNGELENQGGTVELDQCVGIIRASKNSKMFCKQYSSSSYYVTRKSDGETFGSTVSYDRCTQIVEKSRNSLTCQPYSSSSFYLARISDGSTLGSTTSFDECLSQL